MAVLSRAPVLLNPIAGLADGDDCRVYGVGLGLKTLDNWLMRLPSAGDDLGGGAGGALSAGVLQCAHVPH